MSDSQPGIFPLGPARIALERAATAELVVFTDKHAFTTDLLLLRELDPDVRFMLGDRPLRPDTVFVSIAHDGTLFLAAQDPGPVGVYVRISWQPGQVAERAVATDPTCRPAHELSYQPIS